MIGALAIAAVDIILVAIGYTTARILLPTLTLGKVKVEALSPGEAGFNWLGFKRLNDSVLLCEASLAGWIGVLIWVLVLVIVTSLV
jgi:hypothetical protein